MTSLECDPVLAEKRNLIDLRTPQKVIRMVALFGHSKSKTEIILEALLIWNTSFIPE
jgi:hypothetical protein